MYINLFRILDQNKNKQDYYYSDEILKWWNSDVELFEKENIIPWMIEQIIMIGDYDNRKLLL